MFSWQHLTSNYGTSRIRVVHIFGSIFSIRLEFHNVILLCNSINVAFEFYSNSREVIYERRTKLSPLKAGSHLTS